MIVRIKTTKGGIKKAKSESKKFQLGFTKISDDTFLLAAPDNVMLDHILKSCKGSVEEL